MAKKDYVMRNPERLEDILARYNPFVDPGAMGKRADVLVRKAITSKIERAHPAGIADCNKCKNRQYVIIQFFLPKKKQEYD